MNGADRCVFDAVAGNREGLQGSALSRKNGVIDLSEIVIVGGQPKNGNTINARVAGFLCQLYSAKRLVNGEHWAAEEGDLLASEGSRSPGTQAGDVGDSLWGCSPGTILA